MGLIRNTIVAAEAPAYGWQRLHLQVGGFSPDKIRWTTGICRS